MARDEEGISRRANEMVWRRLRLTAGWGLVLLVLGSIGLTIEQAHHYDKVLPEARDAWIAETKEIRWRNAFWNQVAHPDDTFPDTADSKLAEAVRKIFVDKGTMTTVSEWRSLEGELHRENPNAQKYDILDGPGKLSPYALGRIRQISEGPNTWRRESLPDPIDETDPRFHQNLLDGLLAWPVWMICWGAISALGYVVLNAVASKTEDHALLLHIPEAHGAPVERIVLAVLYAPVLLPLAAISLGTTGIWRLPGYLALKRQKTSEWLTDLRNPYRGQIRKARRALEDLRAMPNPDPELVVAAEQTLALWSGRYAEETAKNATEQARAAREARLLRIKTSLLELTSEAEVDDIKGRREGSAAAGKASSGS